MRVLCLVPYPTLGASNRLRVEQYAAPLAARGVTLEVSPFLDDAGFAVLYRRGETLRKALAVLRGTVRRLRDVRRAARYDLVLIHREAAPIGPPLIERALASRGVRYVLDFDDAIFLGPIHPENRRWSWLRPASRVATAARLAAGVIVQNEFLADWARRHNDLVTIIPTPVDTDRFRPRVRPYGDRPLVIGWVGSSTTASYLRLIDEPLARISRMRPVVVRVVGGTYAFPGVPVEEMPYSLEREPEDVAGFDVGILPEPDDDWTKGKGAFKAILYMASGVPVVASRVGVNETVIGDAGLCVDTADGWVDALDRLAADRELRARLGARGRERAEVHYSVRANAPLLLDFLRSVAP